MLIGLISNAQKIKTPTFEETIQPYVEKLLQATETGVEWVSKEIPEVIHQYVLYEAIIAWSLIILGLITIPIGMRLVKVATKHYPNWDTPAIFFAYLFYLIPLLLIFLNISRAILTTFFPKLFLVMEFMNYI